MRILGLCFFPAFVPPRTGGEWRLFGFYKELSRRYQVTLLTSTHYGAKEETIQHGPTLTERRIPKDNFFLKEWHILEGVGSGGDLSGPCLAVCDTYPTALHRAFLEEYTHCDVIIHDFPFTIGYDLFLGLDDKVRVYNAHNCETALYRELHPEPKSAPIRDIVRQRERKALEGCDLLFYCSAEDLVAFQDLVHAKKLRAHFVPHGIPARPLRSRAMPAKDEDRFHGIFIGSGHPPNVEAACFIVEKLAPQLPHIVFHVVGDCLPKGTHGPNVFAHGPAGEELKSALMERAHFALNPMVRGSGSNLKVLDYFIHGLPVFSTPFGMRGVAGRPGVEYIEASLDGMASTIRKALEHPERLKEVAFAAYQRAVTSHSWPVIVASVAEALEKTYKEKKQKCRRFVLALNDYDPFRSKGGGSTRLQGLYQTVARENPVVFLCFSDDGRLWARPVARNITCISVPPTREHELTRDLFNGQSPVSVNDIIAGQQCSQNPTMRAVYGVLREYAENIVCEHCYLVDLPTLCGDRFLYAAHNHETLLKNKLLASHPSKEQLLQAVAQMEHRAVECAAGIISVCHEDARSLLIGKRTAGPVVVVPNGVLAPSLDGAGAERKRALSSQIPYESVVFLGSGHHPNVEAASFIVKNLAPRFPGVTFHLIGSVCSAFRKKPRNVRLWHVVDEATKSVVLECCLCGLNPVVSGSGSNVKLADYLAHGLFVLTTEFGIRGYPESVREHVKVVTLEKFSDSLTALLESRSLLTEEARSARKAFFIKRLSLERHAEKFIRVLKSLKKKDKKKVLFVTYRYTFPVLGGAEQFMQHLVESLGSEDEFMTDIVAPEVSHIHSRFRFSEKYSFDSRMSVPIDIPNVRFARFPVASPDSQALSAQLRHLWSIQPDFERRVHESVKKHYRTGGLTWGWGYPEWLGTAVERWAFVECGLYLSQPVQVYLEGYAPLPIVLTFFDGSGRTVAGPWALEGSFSLRFWSDAGDLAMQASAPRQQKDPRPLAFRIRNLLLGTHPVDVGAATLLEETLRKLDVRSHTEALASACRGSRAARKAELTACRGPWSPALEAFIKDHLGDYDLLVTHNPVFAPPVLALREACRRGVPSILIPHLHLDDDFYHFPDVMEACRLADLVLVTPRIACDFLSAEGCRAQYFPIGCDTREPFSPEDEEAFRKIYAAEEPFLLVLGRKSGSKNYQAVVDAVDSLRARGTNVRVVLIGPDDDGEPIRSSCAVYLGYQPRNVVRGALSACLAVCTMSRSESFGIVILEAWMAGKPVLANKHCAAFQDLINHGRDGLLIAADEIPSVVLSLLDSPELRRRLAQGGQSRLQGFDWKTLGEEFRRLCWEMACHP